MAVFTKLEAWEPNIMYDSGLDARFKKSYTGFVEIIREIWIRIILDNIIVSSLNVLGGTEAMQENVFRRCKLII